MDSIPVRRVIAFLIDGAALWLVVGFGLLFGWEGSVVLNSLGYFAYRGVFPTFPRCDTAGRKLMQIAMEPTHKAPVAWRLAIPIREFPIAFALLSPSLGLKFGLLILFSGAPLLLAVDLVFALTRSDCRTLRDLVFKTEVVEE